jgi:fumarate hydratase subunit alpha
MIRKNTGTNTPCVIHVDVKEGSSLKLIVSPKGFGSENKSKIRMFRPSPRERLIKASMGKR